MLSAARTSGIRVLGPECMGLIVPGRKLNASYASQPVKAGRVAYLGQSGMLGNAMIDWAAGRGIGFSHLITLGDSVDVLLPDLMDYISQFSPAQAILLHLERIMDALHFMTALRDASRNRLVLAIKSGRTAESDISGLPPTPGIANRDQIFDAAFARAGVVRVNDSDELFDALDHWDEVLEDQRYLAGDRLTEADICMFTTLVRFDEVYHTHFMCNHKLIREYDNLWPYLRDLYQTPGIAETVNIDHITEHYYTTHPDVSPKRIVPMGPDPDFEAAHDRDALPGELPEDLLATAQ